MKKIALILVSICFGTAIAQNTFPSSGKTGIFTTSPSEALHVRGNVRVDSSMTVKDSINIQGRTRTFELIVQGNSKFVGEVVAKSIVKVEGDLKAKAKLDVDGETKLNGNTKAMADMTVEGASKLNGSVKLSGIGTTAPVAGLQLIVQLPSGQLKTVDFSYLAGLFGAPELITSCAAGEDVPVPQWIAGLNRLYTDCDKVKVGIGTPLPLFKLDCRGSAYTLNLKVGNIDASETALINGFVLNNTQNLLALGKKVGASPEEVKFKISNNGAVDIANSGAQTTLTLNNGTGHAIVVNDNSDEMILLLQNDGLLKARKIRIDLDTWSDHVFEDGHVLMSLSDVRTFVNANKHLPGVSSEQELKSNGLDVSQMQQQQMEKIEELYLHMFEMSDKMEAMELQMEQLLKENAALKAKMEE